MRVVAGVVMTLVLVSGCGGGGEQTAPFESSASATPDSDASRTRVPESSDSTETEPQKQVRRQAARKAASGRAAAVNRARSVRRAAAVKRAAAKAAAARKAARRFAILDVVDGDTVRVDYRGGVSVRVIGIDTPETVSPSVPDECGGQAASNAARRLLTGKSVTMAFDPTQDRADRYGRPLVYLGVPGVGDFGRAMIQRGRAAEYTYDAAYQRQAGYRSAEGAARSAKRGLWRACGGPDRPLRKPKPAPAPAGGSGSACAAGYSPCVSPFPPDVNCDDVDGPITVTGPDPHELDSDGDGVACES
jgi:endonuclease YncB( thermonuclease family)